MGRARLNGQSGGAKISKYGLNKNRLISVPTESRPSYSYTAGLTENVILFPDLMIYALIGATNSYTPCGIRVVTLNLDGSYSSRDIWYTSTYQISNWASDNYGNFLITPNKRYVCSNFFTCNIYNTGLAVFDLQTNTAWSIYDMIEPYSGSGITPVLLGTDRENNIYFFRPSQYGSVGIVKYNPSTKSQTWVTTVSVGYSTNYSNFWSKSMDVSSYQEDATYIYFKQYPDNHTNMGIVKINKSSGAASIITINAANSRFSEFHLLSTGEILLIHRVYDSTSYMYYTSSIQKLNSSGVITLTNTSKFNTYFSPHSIIGINEEKREVYVIGYNWTSNSNGMGIHDFRFATYDLDTLNFKFSSPFLNTVYYVDNRYGMVQNFEYNHQSLRSANYNMKNNLLFRYKLATPQNNIVNTHELIRL